jgi:hypothetical protein
MANVPSILLRPTPPGLQAIQATQNVRFVLLRTIEIPIVRRRGHFPRKQRFPARGKRSGMTVRGSSTPARFQRAALALAALGILTGGGCIASGPLVGGTSLSELASSKTRRPVVTAAYGESVPGADAKAASDDVSLSEQARASEIPPAADAESAGSPAAAATSGVEPFADDRFADALAELPAAEAAALRQMLSAIREGAPSRPAHGQPSPNGSPATDRVPNIVEERAELVGHEPASSSRRDPQRTVPDPGEYVPSESISAAVSNVPISPFVAGSLAAFTSLPASAGDASPLARAFEASASIPSVRPTNPVAHGSASTTGVAQAGAISEIVNSGDSSTNIPHSVADSAASSVGSSVLDPAIPAPDWHAKLAEATRALSVAIDRPGASETERKSLEAKLRLLQAIEHRFAESLVPINGSPEEQAFWKELCGALQELFDPQATPYDDKRATLALRRLDEATRHLSKTADLDVARLAFCTAVERFGQYDEFEEYVFSADQETLLYVEVRRFAAETVERPYPGYRTALEGSYRIVEVGGGKRWAEHIFPVAEEVSRSPRSDFFIAYRVYLPKNLPAGKYRLEFNLHDQVGDKHGSGWLDFAVKSGR